MEGQKIVFQMIRYSGIVLQDTRGGHITGELATLKDVLRQEKQKSVNVPSGKPSLVLLLLLITTVVISVMTLMIIFPVPLCQNSATAKSIEKKWTNVDGLGWMGRVGSTM